MNQDWLFYFLAVVATLAVGSSKGGLPLVGTLGVPLLTLVISPVAAAALLLPIYIVSDVFGLWMYRRSFDKRNLTILVPAATLGIAIGWATAAITSARLVTLLVAVIGLAYCINAMINRGVIKKKPADVPRGLFWGALAGFTSFVSHSGAPPYQMYTLPQKMEKMVFAGTTTILFAVVNALKIIPYWALGQFNPGNLQTAAILSPAAVLGAYLGYRTISIMPEKLFYRVIEIALALVSIKLLYDAIWPAQ